MTEEKRPEEREDQRELREEVLEEAAGGFGEMKRRPSQHREYEAEAKE